MCTSSTENRCSVVRCVVDSDVAEQILRVEAGIEWPAGCRPCDVRVERVWPWRASGVSFEWSFDTGDGTRHLVYGMSVDPNPTTNQSACQRPVITRHGIRELFVSIPERGIRLQSMDKDPALRHLAECLNGSCAANHCASYWPDSCNVNSKADVTVKYNPLSYRPGRRAALLYELKSDSKTIAKMLGKTYRDDRGEYLQARSACLNEQLTSATKGRIRSPVPLGYNSENRTVFYPWHDSRCGDLNRPGLAEVASAASEVLAVLHRTNLDGLPEFQATDEVSVAERWWALLEMADSGVSQEVLPILEALQTDRSSVPVPHPCVIHRDIYDRQLLIADQAISLLDLDTLSYGDPCLDLGNLIAHVCLSALTQGMDGQALSTIACSALRRYAAHDGVVNRDAFAFYWASALFRLGTIHVHRWATHQHSRMLWEIARRVLGCNAGIMGGPTTCNDVDRIDITHILQAATQ